MIFTSHEGSSDMVVAIGPGQPGTDDVQLRLPSAFAGEVASLLDEKGLRGAPVVMMSAGTDFAVLAASVAGGFGGLAALLNAYFGRHRHRSVRVVCKDGETIDITGMSTSEVAAVVDQVLDKVSEQKRSGDEWLRHYIAAGNPNPYDIQPPRGIEGTNRQPD